MLTPNKLVLTIGGCYLGATFGKNPSRNGIIARVRTDRQTDRQTRCDSIHHRRTSAWKPQETAADGKRPQETAKTTWEFKNLPKITC